MDILEKIKTFFGCNEEQTKKRLYERAVENSERIYTIKKVGDVGMVYLNGKPVSLSYDKDAEHRLYNLRELYVKECIIKKEIL